MITVTRADSADSEAIRHLEKEAHGEDVTSKYDAVLISRFGYAYVAKENGKIIGSITAWQTRQGEVKINDWVVHPEHRRKGIGEKLYLKLIEDTKGKNILSLVDINNAASMNAHQKLGFKIVANIQDAYRLGKSEEQVLWKMKNKQ